jgi:hypothetical protein
MASRLIDREKRNAEMNVPVHSGPPHPAPP